jgi:hypothetical protein
MVEQKPRNETCGNIASYDAKWCHELCKPVSYEGCLSCDHYGLAMTPEQLEERKEGIEAWRESFREHVDTARGMLETQVGLDMDDVKGVSQNG